MYESPARNSIAEREERGMSGDATPVRREKVFTASREEAR
jgi:hypothetical protein